MAEKLIDGITEEEWSYLKTPICDIPKKELPRAQHIFEKRAAFIWSDNAKHREDSKKKVTFA